MIRRGNTPDPRRLESLDRGLLIAIVLLLVATVGVMGIPTFHFQVAARELDVALDTVTTLVTFAVAVLAWVRYRGRGEVAGLLQAAAFAVLVIANALALVLVVATDGATAFLASDVRPLYVTSGARLLAAALMVLGGWLALREARPRRPVAIMLGPALGFAGLIALLGLLGPILPPLGAAGPEQGRLSATPLGAGIQLCGAAAFFWAAALSRQLYRRHDSAGNAFLAVGLVFAGFAEIHLALYPGTYAGLITSGDLLRLAFDIALLLGVEAEARSMLDALQRANRSLEQLRDADAERAALEERARLARELHDGLAQDLWLAKLKVGRLAGLTDLSLEARGLCDELGSAVDAGLGEARQAVMALRAGAKPGRSLSDLLARYVADFADRFGLRTVFEVDGEVPRLTPRAEAELLRIAEEALNNVRRHAASSLVTVRLAAAGGSLTLVVSDDGRGFDPDAVAEDAFGLASMRERAKLIGGQLGIESRPQAGTRVTVAVPTRAPAPASAAS